MKKISNGVFSNLWKKLSATVVMLACLVPQAYAYDFLTVSQPGLPPYNLLTGPLKTIDLQATEVVSGDTIALGIYGFPALVPGDRVVISVTGGATFADSALVLEHWAGGAGTGDLTYAVLQTPSPNGSTSIEFQMQESSSPFSPEPLADVDMFILSGDTYAGQAVNFNLPQVPGRDITLQFEVFDSFGASKGTAQVLLFQSNLPPGLTEQETQRSIANHIGQQMQRRAASGPGLSGLLTGHGFGGMGLGGAGGQAALLLGQLEQAVFGNPLPLSLNMDISGSQTAGEFAFSTDAYRQWQQRQQSNQANNDGRPVGSTLPHKTQMELDNGTNLWIKGRFSKSTDKRRGDEVKSDFGVIYLGADFRYSAATRLGVMAEIDWFDEQAAGSSPDGEGEGWMLGPYLVTRLDEQLILDVRAAYGQSDNKISPIGTFTDSYDTERLLLEANLTGQWQSGNWDILPAIGLLYMEETQKAYTDTNGQFIGSQTISLGSLSFGPTAYYNIKRADGTVIRPMVGLKGIWDFDAPAIHNTSGQRVDDDLRAQIKLGIQASLSTGTTWEGSYTYDGIGVSGHDVHSLELSISTLLKAAGPFKDSKLSADYRMTEQREQQLQLQLGVPLH